jgi:hypothetical protein
VIWQENFLGAFVRLLGSGVAASKCKYHLKFSSPSRSVCSCWNKIFQLWLTLNLMAVCIKIEQYLDISIQRLMFDAVQICYLREGLIDFEEVWGVNWINGGMGHCSHDVCGLQWKVSSENLTSFDWRWKFLSKWPKSSLWPKTHCYTAVVWWWSTRFSVSQWGKLILLG